MCVCDGDDGDGSDRESEHGSATVMILHRHTEDCGIFGIQILNSWRLQVFPSGIIMYYVIDGMRKYMDDLGVLLYPHNFVII